MHCEWKLVKLLSVFALLFSTYLAESQILKIFLYSNKFFHNNFDLSESSFTCPGLRASGLAWRLFIIPSYCLLDVVTKACLTVYEYTMLFVLTNYFEGNNDLLKNVNVPHHEKKKRINCNNVKVPRKWTGVLMTHVLLDEYVEQSWWN